MRMKRFGRRSCGVVESSGGSKKRMPESGSTASARRAIVCIFRAQPRPRRQTCWPTGSGVRQCIAGHRRPLAKRPPCGWRGDSGSRTATTERQRPLTRGWPACCTTLYTRTWVVAGEGTLWVVGASGGRMSGRAGEGGLDACLLSARRGYFGASSRDAIC